jgi:hypothetical protein
MRQRSLSLVLGASVLGALLSGCDGRQAGASAAVVQTAQSLPRGAVTLPPASAAMLLSQCSRAAPPEGEGTWTPTADDILRLESSLPDQLRMFETGMSREQIWRGEAERHLRLDLTERAAEIAEGRRRSEAYDAMTPEEQARDDYQRSAAAWNAFQRMSPDERRKVYGFPRDELDLLAVPNGFTRQYVGIVRNGRRFIYGNFAPAESAPRDPLTPQIICDGGASYFGVEYEPASGRFTHTAFNGAL